MRILQAILCRTLQYWCSSIAFVLRSHHSPKWLWPSLACRPRATARGWRQLRQAPCRWEIGRR
nr:MAG TPA: hypothetical protein [Caudoviricetes sp.]